MLVVIKEVLLSVVDMVVENVVSFLGAIKVLERAPLLSVLGMEVENVASFLVAIKVL